MNVLRRLQGTRWAGTVLAVLLLSQVLGSWRAFFRSPTPGAYGGLILTGTLFLALMAVLALLVYAEERVRGRILRPRPFLDRLIARLLPESFRGNP